MTRRRLLIGLAAASVGGALWFRSNIRITRHAIPWTTRRAFRVVHLTDVHVGWTTPASLLDESARIARSLKPDLVVLTGDYVNRSLSQIGVLEQWIERLPRPCVATLGNHDHWSGADGIARMFDASGVRLLTNERIVHEGIQIVGIDDARTKHHDLEKAFHRVDGSSKVLALQH